MSIKNFILLLLAAILLCGCVSVQNETNNYADDPLLDDLLDGNNTFLGITPGEVELTDAVEIMENYSKGGSRYFKSENSDIVSGVYRITYNNSFLSGALIDYENNQIIRNCIRLTNPITVETILSKFGEDFKLSALVVGLHESQLDVEFIFPERGIEVLLENMPIEEPIIQPDTEVYSFAFYETQTSFSETESIFIMDYDVACAREWQGYGNVMALYYPDADGTRCPYDIP